MNMFQWFYKNGIRTNIDKRDFLLSLNINSKMAVENLSIQNPDSLKFLRVTIDRNLSFNEHVSKLCKN